MPMTRRVSSTKHFTMVRNQLHPHDFTSTYMCVCTLQRHFLRQKLLMLTQQSSHLLQLIVTNQALTIVEFTSMSINVMIINFLFWIQQLYETCYHLMTMISVLSCRVNCIFLLEVVWTETDLILTKHRIAELFIATGLKEGIKGTHPFRALLM